MKQMNVTINVFEKGDRVCTSEGNGTVLYDNFFHEVIVQHDEGISDNPSNEPRKISASIPFLIDED